MSNSNAILFRWSGSKVNIKVALEPHKPVIFIGFNNTLKSITARMIIAILASQGLIDDSWSLPERNWQEYLSKIVTSLSEGSSPVIEVAEAVKEKKLGYILIEDSRVALRKYLETREQYHSAIDELQRKINKIDLIQLRSDITRGFETVESIVNEISLGIASIYSALKLKAYMRSSALYIRMLEDIVKDITKSLYKDVQREELVEENMLPLDVEVEIDECGEKRVTVIDTRTHEQISEVAISTSVSSMLLFKTLALAMSIPIPKLVVIEEPEYALAPLQQIVLARFIGASLSKAKELGHTTYMILVTHSPYIALGVENAKVYYFMYSPKERKFVAEESWPAREFALASLLMLRLGAQM